MSATSPPVSLPDRYRAVRRIAAGGMATVFAAEDTLLGRLVAIKMLSAHFAADDAAIKRFSREARAAARVSDHPHVVTIYDIGALADGTPFIVMEHFAGGTLADRLRAGTPITRGQALAWLDEAASALDHAHRHGIVHRDVKPGNLLLDEHGRLAVGDFGIARMASDGGSLTQTGTVLGTAAYLSPEQALGEEATAASDRYALAVVAFELLAGRRPFNGGHAAAQARAHVESPPRPPARWTTRCRRRSTVRCGAVWRRIPTAAGARAPTWSRRWSGRSPAPPSAPRRPRSCAPTAGGPAGAC
ncbi:MAG: protein kinase [Solirubrobacterales bacterium]